MTHEASQAELDYRAGSALLQSVVWGDCTCYKCRQRREEAITDKALAIIYPKIVIIPNRIKQQPSVQNKATLLFQVRQRNEGISNEFDYAAKESGEDRPRLYYCRNCGTLHRKSELVDEERFCSACAHNMRKCANCGEYAEKRRTYSCKIKGKTCLICMNCKKEFKYCHSCGDMHPPDESIGYNARRFEDGSMERQFVCTRCDKESFLCRCGEKTHSIVTQRNNNGHYVCPSCAEEDQGMQPYYFKPMKLHFKKSMYEGKISDSGFYMGFEIEIAQKHSTIDQQSLTHLLKEKFGKDRLYCMHDGTIQSSTGCHGLEVVSHPFTWQNYKDTSYKWDEMLIFLRSCGWKSNLEGVGFHVHTSKAAWGSFQIYKLLQLVYKNQPWICKIAQRRPTTYCTMSNKDFDEAVLVAKDKKNRKPDHYAAINLNNGNGSASDTIEFRMFQGTLEPLLFHKNMEFVRACFQYTFNFRDMSQQGFEAYVVKNNREYPCLNEFFNILKLGGL
jgi:hypothetical protein